MVRRPTSLQFPLRHRRNHSSATVDETSPPGDTGESASPVKAYSRPLISSATTPDTPYSPPAKSKRRLTFGTSSHGPSKSVTAAAAIQTRAELRGLVRANWTFPPEEAEPDGHYGEPLVATRVKSDTVYVEREVEVSAPSRSPSPAPFSSWGEGNGSMPVVSMSKAHPIEAATAFTNDGQKLPAPAASEPALAAQGGTEGATLQEDRGIVSTANGPYRFEDPESVGKFVRIHRENWAKAQEEERRVNPGFRLFEDRRDAWTGAILLRRNQAGGLVRHQELEDASDDDADDEAERAYTRPFKRRNLRKTKSPKPSGSFVAGSETESPYVTGTDTGTGNDTGTGTDTGTENETGGTGTGTGTDSGVGSASDSSALRLPRSAGSDAADSPIVTLIPRPTPLIQFSHPIRSQITPSAYRSIYTRIVVQGTAPSIPVNLSDIIASCVVGWKADGEWPPGVTTGAIPPASHKLANPLPAHTATTGLPSAPSAVRGKADAVAAALLGTAAAEHIREQALEGHQSKHPPPMSPEKAFKRHTERFTSFITGLGRGGGRDDVQNGGGGTTTDGAPPPPPTGVAEEQSLRQPLGIGEMQDYGELDQDDAAARAGLIDNSFMVVNRGVKKFSRAIKAVGNAMLEAESGYEGEADALEDEVPGLVQGGLAGTFDQVEIGHFERTEL